IWVSDWSSDVCSSDLLDPACGTGGFLASAIDHVRARWVQSADDEAALQASILGIEKKPLPHLLCVTNLLFHGVAVPSRIRRGNEIGRASCRGRGEVGG